MVPGRTSYHTFPSLVAVKMRHLVVRSSELEGEDGEEVFSFKQDSALETMGQVDGVGDGRFGDDIVDARREDESQVVGVAIG